MNYLSIECASCAWGVGVQVSGLCVCVVRLRLVCGCWWFTAATIWAAVHSWVLTGLRASMELGVVACQAYMQFSAQFSAHTGHEQLHTCLGAKHIAAETVFLPC